MKVPIKSLGVQSLCGDIAGQRWNKQEKQSDSFSIALLQLGSGQLLRRKIQKQWRHIIVSEMKKCAFTE
jgi:hypothetical protein